MRHAQAGGFSPVGSSRSPGSSSGRSRCGRSPSPGRRGSAAAACGVVRQPAARPAGGATAAERPAGVLVRKAAQGGCSPRRRCPAKVPRLRQRPAGAGANVAGSRPTAGQVNNFLDVSGPATGAVAAGGAARTGGAAADFLQGGGATQLPAAGAGNRQLDASAVALARSGAGATALAAARRPGAAAFATGAGRRRRC